MGSGGEGVLSVAAWFPVPFNSWSCISVSTAGLLGFGFVAAMSESSSIVALQAAGGASRLTTSVDYSINPLLYSINHLVMIYTIEQRKLLLTRDYTQ